MRNADISSRKKEIVDIFRIKRAVRYAVWRRCMMKYRRYARIVQALGMMVVHAPTAIRDDIVEFAAGGDVILGHNIIAGITAAFTFARQKSHPFQQTSTFPFLLKQQSKQLSSSY